MTGTAGRALTPLQAGMLFHSQLAPGAGSYVQQLVLELPECSDVEALRQAWQRVAARHEALRTVFRTSADAPVQDFQSDVHVPFEHLEAPTLDEFLHRDRIRGFEFSAGPPWRVSWMRPDRGLLCVWSFHHALLDGRSHRRVLDDLLAELYRHGEPPTNPARPFAAHLDWLESRDVPAARDYWKTLLAGFTTPTPLPAMCPPQRNPDTGPSCHSERLDSAALRAFAARHDVTLGTLVQAAWAIALCRYSSETDVVFGATRSGRERGIDGSDTTVGLLINTTPVRVDVSADRCLVECLKCVRGQWRSGRRFDFLGPLDVQAVAETPPGAPLYESIVVFENYRLDEALRERGWNVGVALHEQPHYPLALSVAAGRELSLRLYSDRLRLDDAGAARLLRHVTNLLVAMTTADESTCLSDVPMLDEAERHRAWIEWNATDGANPADRRIEQLVEAQVDRDPGAIAIIADGQSLTYGELESRANQLAHHLRALGVGTGSLVAVCMNRSAEMIVALLAILKSGAAYVPLDPAYPSERRALLLTDTAAAVLLTQVRRLSQLPDLTIPVVCLDADWSTVSLHSALRPARTGDSGDRAYVIYTSGSTGMPKGVVLSHRAVVNTLDWVNRTFDIGPADRLLFVTSICFDLSVYDIFGMLAAGGSIRVASGAELRDPERLLAVLHDEPITIWDSAPSLLGELIRHVDSAGHRPKRSSLRLVLLSGDWIPVSLPDRIRAAFRGASVIALGGATEAAIWSNWFRVDAVDPAWSSIPYGRPIRNACYYLADAHGQPAAVGASADLLIGGACLADGYWNRDDLSTERFTQLTVSESHTDRVYRTGDRARYWPDGTIEFLGRRDQQVKIRGFRIELGELEAALGQHPAISAAAAGVSVDPDGERQLVAYVVPAQGTTIAPSDLRKYLQNRLPEYILPAHIEVLAALPLTANGKLDRRRLPGPSRNGSRVEPVPPRNAIEAAIAAVWCELLGIERVGVNDNFFELGGHSLRAAQLASRLRRTLGRELPLAKFLRHPTIAEAAAALDPSSSSPVELPAAVDELVPASPAQRQLWFLHQMGQGSDVYTIALALSLPGETDAAALGRAFVRLTERHEALRVRFSDADGKLVQILAPVESIQLDAMDIVGTDEINHHAAEFARAGFDLRSGPLWRAKVLRCGNCQTLLLALHHIVIDGQSLHVLLRDLAELYESERVGRPTLLSRAASWFAACRQIDSRLTDRSLNYWRAALTPLPPPLVLPGARRRTGPPEYRGAECPFELPADLSARLAAVSRREGISMFVLCLAAFQALLSRLSGEDDFAVGVPADGRTDPAFETVVGPLMNTLVLRTRLGGSPTFCEFLGRTRDAVHAAIEHQDLPFDVLVRDLKPQRDAADTPLVQILFSFGPAIPTVATSAGPWTSSPISTGTAKFALSLWLSESPEGLDGHFEFDTAVFDLPSIERLAGQFRTLLAAAIANPGMPVAALPLLNEAERRTIVVDWNATSLEIPKDRCVHDLIAQQVERAPDRIAARYEGRSLSYTELNSRANRLARKLKALGVGPDVPVGLYMDRSLDALVAALAVWKAGGAYLPLDPAFPAERIEHYLVDSQTPVVITAGDTLLRDNRRSLLDLNDIPGRFNIVDLIRDAGDIAARSPDNLESENGPRHLAYWIYTSGSTGAPKGVLVPHSALVNFLASMSRQPGLTADDRVLGLTTLSFDIHALELWLPLTVGASVELVSPDVAVDGLRLASAIPSIRPTIVQATPTTWRMLLAAGWSGDLALKALCGGEAMSQDLAAELLPCVGELWNLYGPTETTVWSTIHRVTAAGRPIPIGRPIANTQTYVLDPCGEPVPPGVAGDLVIGGAGVARDYWRQEKLTGERFVDSPFGRVYKTGDRARWRDDGVLEFLGRSDRQVKVRGHRIELAEIEAAIARHPGVRQVVAAAHGDQLAAYLVPNNGMAVTIDDVRGFLRGILPEPHVPSAIAILDALPTTPNGKIDVNALPIAVAPAAAARHVPPRTEVERDLAAVWEEVLNVRPIGATDNFFDLGGHSYLAAILLARIHQRLGPILPLGTLFAAPTVEQLAVVLNARLEAGSAGSLVPLNESGQRPPLFLIAGVGGHVFGFHKFARLLGPDQPVYGVKAIGVDGATPTPDRMEAIAARYAAEITAERPDGAVVLGGYSIGALVAFELALQLQQAGREVGPLIVFDMTASGYPKRKPLPQRLLAHAGNLVRAGGAARRDYLRERIGNLRGRVFDALGLTRWNAPAIDVDALPQDSLQSVWVALREAQLHYLPRRKFAGRVVLFKAADVPAWAAAVQDDPDLGWSDWAEDGVERITVPGGHLEMFAEQNLDLLSRKLNDCLIRAQAATTPAS